MKDQDLVAGVAEAAQAVVERVEVGEQVGDDDDQPAVADLAGDLAEDHGQLGRAVGLGRLQRLDDLGQLGGGGGRAEPGPFLLVEDGQPDGVPLLDQQRGQAGDDRGGVLELGHGPVAVGHAGAGVEDEGGAEVGLLLVAFDLVAVGAGVGPPVESFEVVAGCVLAVVGELDGEAVHGAAVQAGDAALDDALGAEAQGHDLGEDGGVKRGHAVGRTVGGGNTHSAGVGTHGGAVGFAGHLWIRDANRLDGCPHRSTASTRDRSAAGATCSGTASTSLANTVSGVWPCDWAV